ncbi:hypothetical protein ACKWTF_013537 [Chironomus riparius]
MIKKRELKKLNYNTQQLRNQQEERDLRVIQRHKRRMSINKLLARLTGLVGIFRILGKNRIYDFEITVPSSENEPLYFIDDSPVNALTKQRFQLHSKFVAHMISKRIVILEAGCVIQIIVITLILAS